MQTLNPDLKTGSGPQVIPLKVIHPDGRIIYPALISYQRQLILVDCGYPDSLQAIEEAIISQNFQPSNLTDIIITHHDFDHIGALYQLHKKYPHVCIHAEFTEADYIEGRKEALRIVQAKLSVSDLDEQTSKFIAILSSVRSVDVDKKLYPGEQPFDFLNIFQTPGHTEGHISVYVPSAGVCICGDALAIEDTSLVIPFPEYAYDLRAAVRSVEVIAALFPKYLLCYHGGVFTDHLQAEFSALIQAYLP